MTLSHHCPRCILSLVLWQWSVRQECGRMEVILVIQITAPTRASTSCLMVRLNDCLMTLSPCCKFLLYVIRYSSSRTFRGCKLFLAPLGKLDGLLKEFLAFHRLESSSFSALSSSNISIFSFSFASRGAIPDYSSMGLDVSTFPLWASLARPPRFSSKSWLGEGSSVKADDMIHLRCYLRTKSHPCHQWRFSECNPIAVDDLNDLSGHTKVPASFGFLGHKLDFTLPPYHISFVYRRTTCIQASNSASHRRASLL